MLHHPGAEVQVFGNRQVAWVVAVVVQTAGVGFTLHAVAHVPPFEVQTASVVQRESLQAPLLMSGAVRLLWCVDMPVGAVKGGTPPFVVLSTAALWQRLHEMPQASQEEYLLASPVTPPDRLTTLSGAFESRSHVMPAKDFSGCFAVLIAASLVQPVAWQRPQE